MGKCREQHGHSYRLVVNVEGDVSKEVGSPTEGMVMDFDTIKVVWEEHLKPRLDHKDLNEQFLFVTTAENIAMWVLTVFHNHGIPVKCVDLWETETCCARVSYIDVWRDGTIADAMAVSAE